jgi:hypothetical protein
MRESFCLENQKGKTPQEASGESKLSGGVRMNAGFIWHRTGSSGRFL